MARGRSDEAYLFIDGACLRATINKIAERYFGQETLDLSYQRLRGQHDKAFYYDAIPAAKAGETEVNYRARIASRIKLHEKIAVQDCYHVYEGDSRVRRKEVQQKKVDIMIAVDMLTHTVRGNMDRCTLIASDLDFKPLVDALVQEGMFVRLMYPPTDTAPELYASADERIPLTIRSVFPWLEPKLQQRLGLPTWQMVQKSDPISGDQLGEFEHLQLGTVRLFKREDGEYGVYWDDLETVGHCLRVGSGDYDLLRKVVMDQYLLEIPEAPPA